MTALKPCPFCGGKAEYDLDRGRTMTGHLTGTVMCADGCGCTLAYSHIAKTKEQLKDEIAFTWNHRPTEDELIAQLSKAQERVKELEARVAELKQIVDDDLDFAEEYL